MKSIEENNKIIDDFMGIYKKALDVQDFELAAVIRDTIKQRKEKQKQKL
jgi:protein-arginine kinase activator protein McsA